MRPLENGATVVLLPRRAEPVAVVIGFRRGSRDDPERLNGSSALVLHGLLHAFEHSLTHASIRHPSWQALCRAADSFCTGFNALTDKSCLLVHGETDSRHGVQLFNFLADLVKHPLITKAHVAAEVERVRQEIRLYNDDPAEVADLSFDASMFHGTPLSHPILGTEESVARFTVNDFRNLHRRMLVGQQLVIVVVGGFQRESMERAIHRAFGRLRTGSPPQPAPSPVRRSRGNVQLHVLVQEQVYSTIGWPLFGIHHPDRPVMSVIRNHFSSRGSSRVRIRLDAEGYGYSSGDYLWHWEDRGQYALRIPVSPDRFRDMLQLLGEEIRLLRRQRISRDDLELAKQNIAINARVRFRDSHNTAVFIAQSIINGQRFQPLTEYLRRLRAVTRADVQRVANLYLTKSRLHLAAAGPVQGVRKSEILDRIHAR